MGMTPRQYVELLVVALAVAVKMAGRVRGGGAGEASGCRVLRVRGFVTKVASRVVRVIAARVSARFVAGSFGSQVANRAEKAIALDPQQPCTEQDDQNVTAGLDEVYRIRHQLGGCAEQQRGDADNRDRGQRLHHRRG